MQSYYIQKGEKMEHTQYDINDKITETLEKYSDMVRRICFLYLKNNADVDDIFQEVFLKLLQRKTPFDSDEHEKAWLIRVTINKCKDVFKSFWHRNIDPIENTEIIFEEKTDKELMQIVLTLPKKYKDVIYLYYYEGYSVPEMSRLLDKKENTIYSHLHRAKELIKERLEVYNHD